VVEHVGRPEPAQLWRYLQFNGANSEGRSSAALGDFCFRIVLTDPFLQLTLLRTIILWSLSSSEAVRAVITQSYKQNRQEDDRNQPLSVQPWGSDAHKRRYFLIEGLDDTHFRVYRESNPAGMERTWWSVAGDIDELNTLAQKLEMKDGGPKAKKLSSQITAAMERFEAGEEVCNAKSGPSYSRGYLEATS
jgi:hypothetical protein